MRIVEKKYEVYNFSELSEQVKENIIEKFWDINLFDDWYVFIYEDAEQIGLRLTAFNLDRGSYCHGDIIDDVETIAHKILENHGEQCETFKDAIYYLKELKDVYEVYPVDDNGDYDLTRDNVIEWLNSEFVKTLLEDYRTMLQQEYDYRISEEAIIDTIETNEYEFLGNGTIFRE